MNYRDYLRSWGSMPDFDTVFFPKTPTPMPSPGDEDPDANDASPHFFPKHEPGACLGQQPTFDRFLKQITSRDQRVLDVGCGPGRYRDAINVRAQYVGMDLDPDLKPEIVCDFNREPFPCPDQSFDFVFCDSVLEHVMDPFRVVAEMTRVMKPGAYGYLVVPLHYKTHGSPWDYFRFSKSGVHLLLRGFQDVEIYAIGGSFSVLCHICWNQARMLDGIHVALGNVHRAVVWSVFKVLNPLDRFDPYRVFTRGHYAFFRKALDD